MYNVTKSDVVIVKTNNSSIVTLQYLPSSGLITVRPTFNFSSLIINVQCLSLVYMRGHLSDNRPLIPNEILINRSLCLTTCQRKFSLYKLSFIFYLTSLTFDYRIQKDIDNYEFNFL